MNDEGSVCLSCGCPFSTMGDDAKAYRAEWDARQAAEREARNAEEASKDLARWEETTAPRRYRLANLNQYEEEFASRMRDLIREGRWIYAVGGLGTGKTHLACAIMREAIAQRKRPEFKCVPDLLGEIRGSMDGGTGRPEEIVRRLSEVPILVLDDMAAEKTSEWVNETLYRILNQRYNELRQTIITSNLKPQDLGNQRIQSRLMECATVIPLTQVRQERGGKASARPASKTSSTEPLPCER